MLKSLKKISQVGSALHAHQQTYLLLNIHKNTYSYSHRPFINIRRVDKNEKRDILQQQQSQEFRYREQIKKFPEDSSQIRQKIIEVEKHRQSRQFHEINRKIHESEKVGDLFRIFQKKDRIMTIQQHLLILSKLISLDNIKRKNLYAAMVDQSVEDSTFQKKMMNQVLNKIQYVFCRGGFKKLKTNNNFKFDSNQEQETTSLPPEYYIRLVTNLSKTSNIKLLEYSYRNIILKVLTKEILAYDDYAVQKKQNSSFTICSVLTLDDNVQLLAIILKLLNNNFLQEVFLEKDSQEYKQKVKQMIRGAKGIIDYIHIPETSSLISNSTLSELISLYTKSRHLFRMNRSALKSIIKEELRRIKIHKRRNDMQLSKKKSNKKFDEREIQYSPINTLKRILNVQQLFKTQIKQASFQRQLQNSKDNTVIYHQFFLIQHKFHKFFLQQISLSFQLSKLNQHIEFLPLLTSHIQYLYEQLHFTVLAKTQILPLLNQQIEIILEYLKNLKQAIVAAKSHTNIHIIFDRLDWELNKIIGYLSTRQSLRQKIPSSIINTQMQQLLLTPIFKNFSLQQKTSQLVLLNYLVRQDMKSLLEKVLPIFYEQELSSPSRSLKSHKTLQAFLYFNLLASSNYLSILKNSENSTGESVRKSIKYSLKIFFSKSQDFTDSQFMLFLPNSRSLFDPAFQFATCLHKYLMTTNQARRQNMIDLILDVFEDASVANRVFGDKRLEQLGAYSKYFTLQEVDERVEQKEKSPIKIQSLTSERHKKGIRTKKNSIKQNLLVTLQSAKNVIELKIDSMIERFNFMIVLLDYLSEQDLTLVEKHKKKVVQIWMNESELMRYPKLYKEKQIESLFYIEQMMGLFPKPQPLLKFVPEQGQEQIVENKEKKEDVLNEHNKIISQFHKEQIKRQKQLVQSSYEKILEQIRKKITGSITIVPESQDQLFSFIEKGEEKGAVLLENEHQRVNSVEKIVMKHKLRVKYGVTKIYYVSV